MIRHEAVSGPYLRWLQEIQQRHPRTFRLIQHLPAGAADAILRSRGIVPFRESKHWLYYLSACLLEGEKSQHGDVNGPNGARLVEVITADDWLVRVDEGPDPLEAPDPFAGTSGSD